MVLNEKVKICFLGDSITEGAGASTRENGFVSVFGRKTGVVAKNFGIGGTRIARKETPSVNPKYDQCFLDRVAFRYGDWSKRHVPSTMSV